MLPSDAEVTVIKSRVGEDRREFLKRSALAAGGALAVGAVGGLLETPAAFAARLREEGRGKIAAVEHPGAMLSLLKESPAIVERMTNEALLRFTGKKTVALAWRELISPTDVVGIKLNCLAAPNMSTSPSMVAAIVKGLQALGLPNEHIILYEQYPARLTARGSGFELNDDPAKGPLVKHLGGKELLTDEGLLGYEKAEARHASGPSHYANMLKHCTAIISAPVIKDHNLAGVTVGMKSMTHGNINNPHDYHLHDINPAVADIYNHPKIKDKVRVVVCDGLRVQYDGGPQDSNRAKVIHNRIYVTTDPVAIDTWGLKLVEALRKEHGLKPITARHPNGSYLARAEALGLGVHDLAKIACSVSRLS